MNSRQRAITSFSFLALLAPAIYLVQVLLLTNPAMQGVPPSKSSSLLIPGTNARVRQTYTGVAVIDQQLVALFYFFWEVANGGTPGLSLFTVAFLGEIVVVYGLLVLEGQRPGNSGLIVSYITLMGLIFQNVTYACVMPLFFALYFWTSPLVSPIRPTTVLPDAIKTLCVPPAVLAGLVAPSILAALPAPNVVSYDTKQLLMATWQPFPLWVGLIHLAMQKLVPQLLPLSRLQWLRASPRAALRITYAVLLWVGLSVRFAALGVCTAATLFPTLFKPENAAQMRLTRVLIPATALHTAPVSSVAEAMWLLLQWDMTIGSGVVLAWAVILLMAANRAAGEPLSRLMLVALVPAGMALLGSGGCAMALLWARDEVLYTRDAGRRRRE